MKVDLIRLDGNYHYEAKRKTGVPIHIDNGPGGASPMELLLMSVGGCSAIDIVNILKKQRQTITSYAMEIEGKRKAFREANPFESIHVKILLEGDIDESKVVRAARLSFEKYCSVSLTMIDAVAVGYSIILNG